MDLAKDHHHEYMHTKFVYIGHHAMCSFDLPLMKALDWAETFGNFVTIDICLLLSLTSEVLNLQSCLASHAFKTCQTICYLAMLRS